MTKEVEILCFDTGPRFTGWASVIPQTVHTINGDCRVPYLAKRGTLMFREGGPSMYALIWNLLVDLISKDSPQIVAVESSIAPSVSARQWEDNARIRGAIFGYAVVLSLPTVEFTANTVREALGCHASNRKGGRILRAATEKRGISFDTQIKERFCQITGLDPKLFANPHEVDATALGFLTAVRNYNCTWRKS